MSLEVTYNVPLTSVVYGINVTDFIPRSVLIENHSGDSVIFDNTVDNLLVIPAGVTVPINIGHLVYTVRIRTLTNTSGYVRITISDSERDVSNAPILQQLPGGVTIGSNITLAPGTTVGLTPGNTIGLVPGSTIGLTPGNTVGLIPGTGITVNNDVTDPVARSYLAALQGLLPQAIHTFSFAGNVGAGPNAEQTYTLINATTQIAVAFSPHILPIFGYDGLLWVWYELSGIRTYIVNKTYWCSLAQGYQDQFIPQWETYEAYVPAGAKIGIGCEAEGTVLVRI
jgi:hypothetical protein